METKTNALPMDFLTATLSDVLRAYHAHATRYRHLAFSSKELAALDSVTHALTALLPDYTVWRGGCTEPGPPVSCSRPEFIAEVFDTPRNGLIIEQPHYWWLSWPITDKQAFWSALSARQSCHPVIVVFVENNDFAELNQQYFIGRELSGLPVKLWVSTKTASITQGFL